MWESVSGTWAWAVAPRSRPGCRSAETKPGAALRSLLSLASQARFQVCSLGAWVVPEPSRQEGLASVQELQAFRKLWAGLEVDSGTEE